MKYLDDWICLVHLQDYLRKEVSLAHHILFPLRREHQSALDVRNIPVGKAVKFSVLVKLRKDYVPYQAVLVSVANGND